MNQRLPFRTSPSHTRHVATNAMLRAMLRAARVTCVLTLLGVLTAQSTTDLNAAEYQKQLPKLMYEMGQRHMWLGSWARKNGLVPQATAEFLRANEVSEGQNPNAVAVLGIMRSLGDAFWRQR